MDASCMSREQNQEKRQWQRLTRAIYNAIERLNSYSRSPGLHPIDPADITLRVFTCQESLWQWEANEQIERVARLLCQKCLGILMLNIQCGLCKLPFARSSCDPDKGNLLCAECYEDSPQAFEWDFSYLSRENPESIPEDNETWRVQVDLSKECESVLCMEACWSLHISQ